MFDNNMNNNQNYNNGFNGNQSDNQNYNNFSNAYGSGNLTSNSGYSSEAEEMPPVLEPIRPLAFQNNVSAPSLDPLNPMNVMPETIPTNNSIESQNSPSYAIPPYETSSTPVENVVSAPENLNSMPNNNIVNEDNQPVTTINNNYISPYDKNESDDTFVGSPISNPQEDNINSQMIYNNFQQPIKENQNSGYNEISNNNLVTDNFEVPNNNLVTSVMPDSLASNSVINDNLYENSTPIMQVDENNEENPALNIISDQTISADDNLEEKESVDESPTEESEEENNLEISDISLSEPADELISETDLTDLGIDTSYTEPDMLEIMDFESEEETSTDESSEPEILNIKKKVERIKNLVEELKNEGIKIEIEEFDFEKMYQIIIKMDK